MTKKIHEHLDEDPAGTAIAGSEAHRAAPLRHGDPASLEARWGLRKIVYTQEQYVSEYGQGPARPAIRATAAAVIRNPWVGNDIATDLQTPVQEIAPRLAKLLTDRLIEHLGGAANVQAFGKAAIIGTAGELEHGAAMIHTPYFANLVRELLEGEAVIYFSDQRAGAGEPLVIPMCHKTAGTTRDFYQTVTARIADAPRPDEIVVIAAASTGPRPHPRVGDRTTDPKVKATDLESIYS